MKLSELIAFRNRLDEIKVDEAQVAANYKLDQLMHLVEHPLEQSIEPLTKSFIPDLKNRYALISQTFDNFDQNIELVKKRVQEQIVEQENHWFQESYRLFEEAELCEKPDQILYGRQPSGDKSPKTIESDATAYAKLSGYADWRWPGIIIRPGAEDFVNSMVGCDPLYIVDQEYDLLKPALNRFPELYQNRLRPYVTNEWSDDPILNKIPNGQFGVCLVNKVFDYRPLEIIRRYLEEIYQKLRPGGALIMTYNDCDRAHAVVLVEQFCTSYTPGYLIRDLVQNVGFELVYTWSDGGPSVWLELRKPGNLTSFRGGQTLGKLHHITDYIEDIDFITKRHYNKEELEEFKLRAVDYGAVYNEIANLSAAELVTVIENLWPTYQERCRVRHEEAQRLGEIERQKQLKLQKKQEKQERKRIANLHELAKSRGINFTIHTKEEEIHRLIAEDTDRVKKEELRQLRQRAMQLNAGDPNLIKYGYSAEKLKQLIKAKEEGQ